MEWSRDFTRECWGGRTQVHTLNLGLGNKATVKVHQCAYAEWVVTMGNEYLDQEFVEVFRGTEATEEGAKKEALSAWNSYIEDLYARLQGIKKANNFKEKENE